MEWAHHYVLSLLIVKNMKYILIVVVFTLSLPFSFGQEALSLEQAKMLTLENNFGIRISENNVQLAENLTDKRANGYRPTISASGAVNATYGSASQKFSTGLDASTKQALSWNSTARVQADYMIYDKSRELTLDQLKESLKLSNLQLQQAVHKIYLLFIKPIINWQFRSKMWKYSNRLLMYPWSDFVELNINWNMGKEMV